MVSVLAMGPKVLAFKYGHGPSLNPRALGPVASTLTTTPPRRLERNIQSAFYEKVPAGGCRLWCGAGECVLVGGLKGCYWWKTV
jgi:hypothetical protein